MTKYDCSSADLNVIGSISKIDLIKFLKWAIPDIGFAQPGKVGGFATLEIYPYATAERSLHSCYFLTATITREINTFSDTDTDT